MAKIILEDGKFYLDEENGTELKECKRWLEISKKNEAHPDGKRWIKLPKDNITNRTYVSEDLFDAENVNGVLPVEIKTSAPRVLGSSGVKQTIVKYLSEEEAAEYTTLVNTAVEAYKAAKANTKKKKPEDMTVEELEAYIAAIKEGRTITVKTGPKSFIDMFDDAGYARYNELLAIAQENKANAPRAKRGPLTDEEKAARTAKRKLNELSKAEKLLAALRASAGTDSIDDEDIDDIDDIDLDDEE